MYQQPGLSHPVNVLGVHLQVVDRHRRAAVRGDADDAGWGAVQVRQLLADRQSARRNEVLPVFAPDRMRRRYPQRFRQSFDFDAQQVGRQMLHGAGDNRAASAVVRFNRRTGFDGHDVRSATPAAFLNNRGITSA